MIIRKYQESDMSGLILRSNFAFWQAKRAIRKKLHESNPPPQKNINLQVLFSLERQKTLYLIYKFVGAVILLINQTVHIAMVDINTTLWALVFDKTLVD